MDNIEIDPRGTLDEQRGEIEQHHLAAIEKEVALLFDQCGVDRVHLSAAMAKFRANADLQKLIDADLAQLIGRGAMH